MAQATAATTPASAVVPRDMGADAIASFVPKDVDLEAGLRAGQRPRAAGPFMSRWNSIARRSRGFITGLVGRFNRYESHETTIFRDTRDTGSPGAAATSVHNHDEGSITTILPSYADAMLPNEGLVAIPPPPPPSFGDVMLRDEWRYILRSAGVPSQALDMYLEEFELMIPSHKATSSEECLAIALQELMEAWKLSGVWFPKEDTIMELTRWFLLSCVARDCDIPSGLVTLPRPLSLIFVKLYQVYIHSWLYQNLHGWDSVSNGIARSINQSIYKDFIEVPLRRLGVPVSIFLWHLRVHASIHRAPQFQRSCLSGRRPGFVGFTVPALRGRGQSKRLDEVLRINGMILLGMQRPIQSEAIRELGLEWCPSWHAELTHFLIWGTLLDRRTYIPEDFESDRFRYTLSDNTAWHHFERINCMVGEEGRANQADNTGSHIGSDDNPWTESDTLATQLPRWQRTASLMPIRVVDCGIASARR